MPLRKEKETGDLFQKYHFLCLGELVRLQTIEVNTRRHQIALTVCTVPDKRDIAGFIVA